MDPPQDACLFHWIGTRQTYWNGQSMDDIVQKLIATMETPGPKVATQPSPGPPPRCEPVRPGLRAQAHPSPQILASYEFRLAVFARLNM